MEVITDVQKGKEDYYKLAFYQYKSTSNSTNFEMPGYESRNRLTLDRKYICPICSLILKDPVQLMECGHRTCQNCFHNLNETSITCTLCKKETSKETILLDRGFNADMESLTIDCHLCPWMGTFFNYKRHLDEDHPNCTCLFCDQEFKSVEALNYHKTMECEKNKYDCALKLYGCTEQIVPFRKREHYLTEKHQKAIGKFIREKYSKLSDSSATSIQIETNLSPMASRSSAQQDEIYEIINIFAGTVDALNGDAQRLSRLSLQKKIELDNLLEETKIMKTSIEESHSFLEAAKFNLDVLNNEISTLNEKIDDLHYVSHDGTFIWRITNIQGKIDNAVAERQISIYSPSFYSSPTGYKMRARLYLNGDGNARGTHISLFFVLMRGKNDPILKFPFHYKVTFCLYDQSEAQAHVVDSFRPDIKSNSFQRPRSEMNIASGIPKFLRLEQLLKEKNSYIRDDTMFIKIMVDFSDMPKNLLSYMLRLNPAIPTDVQHMMTREYEQQNQ